ncbi:MAG: hypothetical protein ABI679_01535 [Gemmatimonadota bacterium]
MTSSSPVRVLPAVQIPELGPALGRVAMPSRGKATFLDQVRLDLATAIFDMAADARSWSSAGDRQAAVDSLGQSAWLGAWEAAVRTTALQVAAETDARIEAASLESRIPRARRKKLLLSQAERRSMAARLGTGGFALGESLALLHIENQRMRESGVLDRDAGERWRAALTTAARKVESAWISLEEEAQSEWARWTPLVESARAWRRPRWPLWLITAVLLSVAIYVGLVVGGYLHGPAFLDRFAQWWWDWWDRLVEPA